MSREVASHHGSTVTVLWSNPGEGIKIASAATSAAAGTVGYAPGAILLTTTTAPTLVLRRRRLGPSPATRRPNNS